MVNCRGNLWLHAKRKMRLAIFTLDLIRQLEIILSHSVGSVIIRLK